jgi:hypothetical protein
MASILAIQPPEEPRPRRSGKRRTPRQPMSDAEAIAREFAGIRGELAGVRALRRSPAFR